MIGHIGHMGHLAALMVLASGFDRSELDIEIELADGQARRAMRPQRRWSIMAEPHDYPLNPFESRQVRRARARRLAKRGKS